MRGGGPGRGMSIILGVSRHVLAQASFAESSRVSHPVRLHRCLFAKKGLGEKLPRGGTSALEPPANPSEGPAKAPEASPKSREASPAKALGGTRPEGGREWGSGKAGNSMAAVPGVQNKKWRSPERFSCKQIPCFRSSVWLIDVALQGMRAVGQRRGGGNMHSAKWFQKWQGSKTMGQSVGVHKDHVERHTAQLSLCYYNLSEERGGHSVSSFGIGNRARRQGGGEGTHHARQLQL